MISDAIEPLGGGEWEEELERQMPFIPWREPLPITPTDGPQVYACRYCIARYGINLEDKNGLAETIEEFENHMIHFHERFPFTPKFSPSPE